MTVEVLTGDSDGSELRIGIVQSRFNEEICETLLKACLDELAELNVADEDILVCTVPGALEIPQALLQMGNLEEFDALIALGAVVKGDTYHFEVVCNESAAGVSRVSLELGVPIANAILTSYTEQQAESRAAIKGAEAARVAIEMANLSAAIESLGPLDEGGSARDDDDDEDDEDDEDDDIDDGVGAGGNHRGRDA